jgi:MraZ protein
VVARIATSALPAARKLGEGEKNMSKTVRVDQKGRLKIPVSLLTALKEFGAEFFITSEDGEAVRIYPLRVWNEIEKRLVRMCWRNRNRQKLLTRAKYFGQIIKMDDQGRVLIPAVLRETAQMKGEEVDVLDYQNYLEVWNHSRFVNNLNRSPITAQDANALNRLAS